MGDTGSQFLGFSLAVISLNISQGNTALSPVLPLIILGFPVLDTLTVMGERISKGVSPFSADKNHFHHRLMSLGLYHNEAVFVIYIIHALFVILAFLLRYNNEWMILCGYLIFSFVILSFFFVTGKKAWKFKRVDIIDNVIKGRLSIARKKGMLIKIFFKCIEAGVPLLLIFTCFLPVRIPEYLIATAISLIIVLAATWFLKRNRLRGALTFSLYCFIPIIIYLTNMNSNNIADKNDFFKIYNLLFLAIILFVVMTLRFTKRKKGFRATTMDFLILFIALVAPYIIGTYHQHKELGVVAAKSIALYFSYEVLIGELRGQYGRLTLAMVAALCVIVVRGILQI